MLYVSAQWKINQSQMKEEQVDSVQLLRRDWLFATPWTVAHQASLVHHQLLEFTHTQVHRVGDAYILA